MDNGQGPPAGQGRRRPRRARGLAIIIAILLVAVLATLTLAASGLLRPAVRTLDEYHEAGRAQALADDMLRRTLAELGRHAPLPQLRVVPEGEVTLKVLAQQAGTPPRTMQLRIVARLHSSLDPRADGRPSAWTVAALTARLTEDQGWKVAEYQAEEVRREVAGPEGG